MARSLAIQPAAPTPDRDHVVALGQLGHGLGDRVLGAGDVLAGRGTAHQREHAAGLVHHARRPPWCRRCRPRSPAPRSVPGGIGVEGDRLHPRRARSGRRGRLGRPARPGRGAVERRPAPRRARRPRRSPRRPAARSPRAAARAAPRSPGRPGSSGTPSAPVARCAVGVREGARRPVPRRLDQPRAPPPPAARAPARSPAAPRGHSCGSGRKRTRTAPSPAAAPDRHAPPQPTRQRQPPALPADGEHQLVAGAGQLHLLGRRTNGSADPQHVLLAVPARPPAIGSAVAGGERVVVAVQLDPSSEQRRHARPARPRR